MRQIKQMRAPARRICFISCACAALAVFLLLMSVIFFFWRTHGADSDVFAASGDGNEGKECKVVALTFDDGPHPVYTPEILDILTEYGVRATFFCIGINAERYPDILKRTSDEGHCIGNHTYSHPKMKDIDSETLASEIRMTEEVIFSVCGLRPSLFRPPEGYRGPAVTEAAGNAGYDTVLWNVDTLDWTGAGCASIVDSIMDNVKNGSIILCHDYVSWKSHTAEALKIVIPRLLSEGYRFVTVDELVHS